MNINLHIINASKTLDPFLNDIQEVFDPTVKRIREVLPVDNVDIIVWDNPEWTIPDFGIGGHTLLPHVIAISVDPKNSNSSHAFKENFSQTLMHELHHAARMQVIGVSQVSRLEHSILEGLAEHFEIELTGKKPDKWDIALTPEQLEEFTKIAKENKRVDGYYVFDWLFGNKELEIPEYTGFSVGFYLVGEYLKKHPSAKASALYAKKAEEFII